MIKYNKARIVADQRGKQIELEIVKRSHGVHPEEPKMRNVTSSELYDADPNCEHEVYAKTYSGIVCIKCSGWFCF